MREKIEFGLLLILPVCGLISVVLFAVGVF